MAAPDFVHQIAPARIWGDDSPVWLKALILLWRMESDTDAKLESVVPICSPKAREEKVIVFTHSPTRCGISKGSFARAACRDSPESPATPKTQPGMRGGSVPRATGMSRTKRIRPSGQKTNSGVLVATDVLSEGQNLQDAAIIVNFDLPWAIIRLIQRAGRVDRIGQNLKKFLLFLPAPPMALTAIIRLRARVRQRP